jgi:hypothetical protein
MNLFCNSSPVDPALGVDYSGAGARLPALAAPASFADNARHVRSRSNDQRRAAPHCTVVNLVRSGRKQP